MTKRGNPDRIEPALARAACEIATDRGKVWTEYIIRHYRTTGILPPGCDAIDLFAWVDSHNELTTHWRKQP